MTRDSDKKIKEIHIGKDRSRKREREAQKPKCNKLVGRRRPFCRMSS